jgi:hypothetical protein
MVWRSIGLNAFRRLARSSLLPFGVPFTPSSGFATIAPVETPSVQREAPEAVGGKDFQQLASREESSRLLDQSLTLRWKLSSCLKVLGSVSLKSLSDGSGLVVIDLSSTISCISSRWFWTLLRAGGCGFPTLAVLVNPAQKLIISAI